jgi:hypothetical protein
MKQLKLKIMTTIVNQIKREIEKKGGITAFPAKIRRSRVTGRPTRFNLLEELKELSDAELNIAFSLGLIGNNTRKGTIVENSTRYGNICNL